MMFRSASDSHAHSLHTLNALYQYDDFMLSIRTMIDFGCGAGVDLEWWATRTTRDDSPLPLNIDCTGVDLATAPEQNKKYHNMNKVTADFESYESADKKFDVLWCHDAFQYAINPIGTLIRWRELASPGAMLALAVPQTTNVVQRQLAFELPSGCYYHHSMVSLIYMLALTGWDCRAGFFSKRPEDPWIHAVVYRSDQEARDPKTTTWYDLVETKLLPESAEKSVMAHGRLRQQDLILPWLDQSLTWFGKH
jgi:SAM-dependent methyltransferase